MKKKRTIVSLARGVRPELREKKGIKIDKAGRARRGGKFLTLAAVARAVTSLKKTPKRRMTRAVPTRETARERQMRQRAERAEKLIATQEARIAKQREEMRTLRARQKRAVAKAKREADVLKKARRAEAKVAREEKKRRTALEVQRAQAQKRLEEAAKAAPPPPPEPEPERKPRKGKKPKKGKKKPPVELPDSDEIILASWHQLTYEQQQIARTRLSAAGKKELDRRERERFEREQTAKPGAPVVAAKSPDEMRADLIKAIKRKGAKKAIAEEVNNAIVREKPVPAWEEQHRATMRHPNMIVQTDKEAIKAANKGEYPKRERKGTRYHATIVCITQHPPLQKYGPTTIDGFEDLFVMYVSAQGATSRTGIKQNVARAIREVLMQVPGGAPIFVAAIEVRTSRKKEK